MPRDKLLLCTDMDRTVIPNGSQAESPDARERFAQLCDLPQVTLVYVTGRHQALIKQAIADYQLPEADYAITDVGTIIYHIKNGTWHQLQSWHDEIDHAWNGYSHEQIKQLLADIKELSLQETEKQNTHKLSYYLPLQHDSDDVMSRADILLRNRGIAASLIWSIDEAANTGLLDVLPQNATKLHAIEFLQQQLGYTLDEVIFAGDSGNDMPVLTSPVHSVLVANASDDVRQTALRIAKHNGHADALYLANTDALNMNGNYSAGVLQGIWHFVPGYRDIL